MKKIISIVFSIALFPAMLQAQSCNNAIIPSSPTTQFQVGFDETLDSTTNLIWKRCSVGQTWTGSSCSGVTSSLTWSQALATGTNGWRLPNIRELLSIVEVSCDSPAINTDIFPNTSNLFFWTGSPYDNNNNAWVVSFSDGNDEGGDKATGRAVRLVKHAYY